jgi:hypothetical protein
MRPTADELARCGARGSPVTVAKLVDVFRARGITLAVDEDGCTEWARENGGPRVVAASNAPSASGAGSKQVLRREGLVVCRVDSVGSVRTVDTVTVADPETAFTALNVHCAVYPSDAGGERAQVARLRGAMHALVEAMPAGG